MKNYLMNILVISLIAAIVSVSAEDLSNLCGGTACVKSCYDFDYGLDYKDSASVIISGGSVRDILSQSEKHTYTLYGKNYEVTATYVSSTGAKLTVNEELTRKMAARESFILPDGISVDVLEILPSLGSTPVRVSFVLYANRTEYKDSCDGDTILENYCEQDSAEVKRTVCEYGCNAGICNDAPATPTCIDTDDGLDYFQKGAIKKNTGEIILEDYCDGNALFEAYCGPESGGNRKYGCEHGCSDGACLKAAPTTTPTATPTPTPTPTSASTSTAAPVEKDECLAESGCDDKKPCTIDSCTGTPKKCSHQKKDGCDYGDKCLPISIRAGDKYCDVDGEMKGQIAGEGACENNYECLTNVCIDSKCLAPGLFRKILNWILVWFS